MYIIQTCTCDSACIMHVQAFIHMHTRGRGITYLDKHGDKYRHQEEGQPQDIEEREGYKDPGRSELIRVRVEVDEDKGHKGRQGHLWKI